MNVRALRDDEIYCLAYSGECSTPDGKLLYYFNHQERDLIGALWRLNNNKVAQFEYLLFAFLYEVLCNCFCIKETEQKNPRLIDVFRKLSNKYVRTWYTQARNVIPHEKVYDLHREFIETYKVNLDLLNEILGDINSWKIVLYNHLYVESRHSLLRADCDE
jgi:hypothetical protein